MFGCILGIISLINLRKYKIYKIITKNKNSEVLLKKNKFYCLKILSDKKELLEK